MVGPTCCAPRRRRYQRLALRCPGLPAEAGGRSCVVRCGDPRRTPERLHRLLREPRFCWGGGLGRRFRQFLAIFMASLDIFTWRRIQSLYYHRLVVQSSNQQAVENTLSSGPVGRSVEHEPCTHRHSLFATGCSRVRMPHPGRLSSWLPRTNSQPPAPRSRTPRGGQPR